MKDYLIGDHRASLFDEEWEVLIILDACRYDAFKQVCGDYVNGRLYEAMSPAQRTKEWMKKTFRRRYHNTTYYSGNPYINSMGVRFPSTNYFNKVVDVWDTGWDKRYNTVLPKQMNKAFRGWNREGRAVFHYMQPHHPYVGGRHISYESKLKPTHGKEEPALNWRHKIYKNLVKTLGQGVTWQLLRFRDHSQAQRIFLAEGWSGLWEAYLDNLRLALKSVAKIVDGFDGRILITSDHGEYMGEWGYYEHYYYNPRRWPVTKVPWMEAEK